MPFNVNSGKQTYTEVEVMKFPAGLNAIKSVVLDANNFPVPAYGFPRYQVQAGTILVKSATNTDKYVEYAGSGKIEGILRYPIDMLVNSTAGSEPAAMLFHEAVFATGAIHNFTLYASALVNDMKTCKFE